MCVFPFGIDLTQCFVYYLAKFKGLNANATQRENVCGFNSYYINVNNNNNNKIPFRLKTMFKDEVKFSLVCHSNSLLDGERNDGVFCSNLLLSLHPFVRHVRSPFDGKSPNVILIFLFRLSKFNYILIIEKRSHGNECNGVRAWIYPLLKRVFKFTSN